MDGSIISHHITRCLLSITLLSTVMGMVFIKEPEDKTIEKGQTVILDCQVNISSSMGDIQWTRDSQALGNKLDLPGFPRYKMTGEEQYGEFHLLIHSAQLEDDAEFSCQVGRTQSFGGEMSRPAKLTIRIPPFKVNIDGAVDGQVAVVVNKPTNLSCTAEDTKPAATFKWMEQGVEVTDAGRLYYQEQSTAESKLVAATSWLTVTAAESDRGHSYTCEGHHPSISNPRLSTVQLNVLYPPKVTMRITPQKQLYREHEEVSLSCQATGNPEAVTWKWYKGEVELEDQTDEVLQLTHLSREYHRFSVSCEATNAVGSTAQKYQFNIRYGPQFLETERYVAVDVGDKAVMQCLADGNPQPVVSWRRKGEVEIRGSSPNFTLLSVGHGDLGVYICSASSIDFPVINQEFHLLKKGPPVVISEELQWARFGETGRVECIVHSVPKPTGISWYKDLKILDVDAQDRYLQEEEDLPTGRKYSLIIKSVQQEDYGSYNCTVKNDYGSHAMAIVFEKKDVIPVAYILAGVIAGVCIIIIIAVAFFIYHRRKNSKSDNNSQSSDASIAKKSKSDMTLEPPLEYRDTYAASVDAWRQQQDTDQRYYRNSADYDELSYPSNKSQQRPMPDPMRPGSAFDYSDGYGNHGYNDYRNFGTYPGPVNNRPPVHRYEGVYGGSTGYPGSDYGGYRPQPGPSQDYPRPEYGSDYGTAPTASVDGSNYASRLSTNV